MSLDVLFYRIFRNRRMIVLGVLLPVLVVCLANSMSDHSHPILMGLAILIPAAHAIRYPNVAGETINVSLTLSVCLALAATISPELSLAAVLSRVFWLFVAAFLVFMALTIFMPFLYLFGAETPVATRTVATSKLDPAALRNAITYYPGREDARVTCGPADEKGIFDVETRLLVDKMDFGCDVTDEDQPQEDEDIGPEDARIFNDMREGLLRTQMKAMVFSSSDEHHEVFVIAGEGEEVIAVRHEFQALKRGGTKVIYQEQGDVVPRQMLLSMWLSDYVADYLTDEIDRAEGRSSRANRAFANSQMIVDIARLMMPGRRGGGPEAPATSDAG
ncbi:hypothetical protein AIOL_002818 [Candidatus Rhodobacter oscarellae]|uniref:Uncharacterized protein n=1 Tax=Candidatus Rhodobacter oscarellae TaxID=1675527 RepID=A0A0J9E4X2_9RHOB|nr:hypothetical protein [Candidatus Rhodobacter lobularis]KMW57850.1 hypothetical protein AIOL_002818 [Candidatus Rhodobacter lobularis]